MNREEHQRLGLERIAFFSDAVMAIAITLLVIELKLPDGAHDVTSIFHGLFEIRVHLLSYVVSFCVVGLFWEAHHRMFTLLRRYDRGFIWLNIFFLLFIGLLPFSTGILGEHFGGQSLIVYSINVAAIGVFRSLLWLYSARRLRLTELGVSKTEGRAEQWRALIVPLVFLASIPLALRSPLLASLSWLLIIPLSVAGRRWIGH